MDPPCCPLLMVRVPARRRMSWTQALGLPSWEILLIGKGCAGELAESGINRKLIDCRRERRIRRQWRDKSKEHSLVLIAVWLPFASMLIAFIKSAHLFEPQKWTLFAVGSTTRPAHMARSHQMANDQWKREGAFLSMQWRAFRLANLWPVIYWHALRCILWIN